MGAGERARTEGGEGKELNLTMPALRRARDGAHAPRARTDALRAAAGGEAQQRIASLAQTVAEMRDAADRAQAEKINLVVAMEAEEKCMLGALQKLDEARKDAQRQCQAALERVRALEEESRRLGARAAEAQETADAAAGAEGELRSLVREAQDREREREREIAALSGTVERQQAELEERELQIRRMQAQEDERERRVQDLLDELARWKNGDLEVKELQRKLAHLQERHQGLTVRYERMEAALHASRQASEDSKLSHRKELDAREHMYKKEIDALSAQLRSANHALHDSQAKFEFQLTKNADETRKEAQLRKEADAREEASRVLARELERKAASLHEQVDELRRHQEESSLALNESAHRYPEPLSHLQDHPVLVALAYMLPRSLMCRGATDASVSTS